jgi:hypothetical protein
LKEGGGETGMKGRATARIQTRTLLIFSDRKKITTCVLIIVSSKGKEKNTPRKINSNSNSNYSNTDSIHYFGLLPRRDFWF